MEACKIVARNYYPYMMIGIIDNGSFLIVQDRLSAYLVDHWFIHPLSATMISGTVSSSFSFFIGMYIHGRTKDPVIESRWYYEWLFLTIGNGIVCIISSFL